MFDIKSMNYSPSISLIDADGGYQAYIEQNKTLNKLPSFKTTSAGYFEGLMIPAGRYFDVREFSMFGTRRPINIFSFSIHKNDVWQGAYFTGTVAYRDDSELSIHDRNAKDSLHLQIELSEADIDHIAGKVTQNNGYKLAITIHKPTGFYSLLVPMGAPDTVKILTQETKAALLGENNSPDIQLPTLGYIESLSISFELPVREQNRAEETNYEQPKSSVEKTSKEIELNVMGLLHANTRTHALLEDIKSAIWFAAILVGFTFLVVILIQLAR